MSANRKQTNFDGLLAAWLAALDTHQLNKKFYGELFAWFERPRQQAKFPKAPNPEEPLICLIPGFLFVWFLKEKNLIAPALFRETYIALLLKNYDRNTGDSYYRALLQLFQRTPLINGGLFDCLDSEETPTQGGHRIDCFPAPSPISAKTSPFPTASSLPTAQPNRKSSISLTATNSPSKKTPP